MTNCVARNRLIKSYLWNCLFLYIYLGQRIAPTTVRCPRYPESAFNLKVNDTHRDTFEHTNFSSNSKPHENHATDHGPPTVSFWGEFVRNCYRYSGYRQPCSSNHSDSNTTRRRVARSKLHVSIYYLLHLYRLHMCYRYLLLWRPGKRDATAPMS
jgi:hypothetical protein